MKGDLTVECHLEMITIIRYITTFYFAASPTSKATEWTYSFRSKLLDENWILSWQVSNFGFKLWLLHFVMDVHRCLNELWLWILASLNTNTTNQDKELGHRLSYDVVVVLACFISLKDGITTKNLGVMTYVIAIFVSNHQFISVGRLKIWWWLSYFQPSYNKIRKC